MGIGCDNHPTEQHETVLRAKKRIKCETGRPAGSIWGAGEKENSVLGNTKGFLMKILRLSVI